MHTFPPFIATLFPVFLVCRASPSTSNVQLSQIFVDLPLSDGGGTVVSYVSWDRRLRQGGRIMIRLDMLSANAAQLHEQWSRAVPFEHVIIDGFCDPLKLEAALASCPQPETAGLNKSRDYIFAKNKFEKSNFREICGEFDELYGDLLSDDFQAFLASVTGNEEMFVDPDFHGGGLHTGGRGSFLDMHADFNVHPEKMWMRELNILLYMNKDWRPGYGGELNLRHRDTGEAASVEPVFNRCVVMLTKEHTLHGYSPICFPENMYRRSIAAYSYTDHDGLTLGDYRSTTWYPTEGGPLKRFIGKAWPTLVRWKTRIAGSATARNR